MLILDDPATWPEHVTRRLNKPAVIELLRRCEFMDDAAKNPAVGAILAEVEDNAATTPIGAYHCTKQLPERPLTTTGLRLLDFEQHHAELRELLRSRAGVSRKLYAKIDAGLTHWQKDHGTGRKKRIWFCIDRSTVLNPGTEEFFQYYGGEAAYGKFLLHPDVLAVFESLGEPIVVEFRIRKKDLIVSSGALGKTLVSHSPVL